ncbi:MAG TPA: ABC transporter permease [Gemmatimonadales bacterium]|nr:ABC transporter permease [Gemmatimonadales bacterium]
MAKEATSEALTAAPLLSPLATTVIEPGRGWVPLKLRELWEYREVLYYLIWRDIKVKYRQTLIGAAWAIVQPLMTMVVFSVFLGRLAKVPSDGAPYPLFTFAALVPWSFFANGVTQSASSLVASGNLITKVYFPRLLVPMARVLSGLPDIGFSFLVLVGLVAIYGHFQLSLSLLWLPVMAVLALLTAFGIGLWLSALNVQYRDIQHAVPFLVQIWLFATPIAYPSSLLAEPWRTIYGLNPMVGVVEGFRWGLLGSGRPPGMPLVVSVAAALVLVVSGAFFFRRVERTFADVI